MSTVEPIREKSDIQRVKSVLRKQSLRNLLLFLIGINCGLRISDILNLDVRDVRGKDNIYIIEQKTGKHRIVPINRCLQNYINEFVKAKRDEEPLFVSYKGNRMSRFTAYNIIRKACRDAGIDTYVGTHTMRKTFGYHFYKRYNNVVMLQKIFNHSHPVITLSYIGIEQDEILDNCRKFVL